MTRKTYTGEEIDVTFDLKQCIHTGRCTRGLPEVFDTKKRPWIQIGESEAQQILDVVGQCPSGALRVQNKDGSEAEQAEGQNTVRIIANGPLYVRGNLQLAPPRGEEGEPSQAFRLALCRCGASENKPFCDNSHRDIEFTASGKLPQEVQEDEQSTSGGLAIKAIPNGPLILAGEFELLDEEGHSLFQSGKAVLCRCGASMNKPFCDSTHKSINFEAP